MMTTTAMIQTEPEVSSAAVFARLCDALAAGEDG